jgi:hypothetical protein
MFLVTDGMSSCYDFVLHFETAYILNSICHFASKNFCVLLSYKNLTHVKVLNLVTCVVTPISLLGGSRRF